MNKSSGISSIIIATIILSLMKLLVKGLDRIPTEQAVFFRAIVTISLCLVWFYKNPHINIWGVNKRLLWFRGLVGSLALNLYFYTLKNLPFAAAATLQYLSPIFTITIASIWLKEKPTIIQIFGFLLAIIGALLIRGGITAQVDMLIFIGILSAILSGLAYNLVRKLRDTDHQQVIIFYFPLVTLITVCVPSFINWVTPTPSELIRLIFMGVLAYLGQVFLTRAYMAEKAANVAIYNYLGVFLATLYGFIFFAEIPTLIQFFGMFVVCIAILIGGKKTKEKVSPNLNQL